MARQWNGRWKNNRWEYKDPWQHREPEENYGWLKRLAAAVVIFAVVYVLHFSDSVVGRAVTEGVRYTLTTETDLAYLADKLAEYAPKNMDVSVLKRIGGNVTKPADPLLYMTRPVDGKVLSPFGWQSEAGQRRETMQEGVRLEGGLGTSVKAAAAGRVKMVGDSARYGKVLVIEHGQDIESFYGHLGEVLVKEGETVSQGQVVARVGKTGMATGPQLYFEVREKGSAIDPFTRIKGDTAGREGK